VLCAPAAAAAQTPAQTPAGTVPTATTPTPATTTSATAEQFAGLTDAGQIVLFQDQSPGNLQHAVTVTGLQPDEKLLGLDGLSATGRLYALGSSFRIYTVDPITGAATPVSTSPFSPPLNGQSYGFSIDPSTLLARSVSDTGQNLRISVTNGQVAGVDVAYAYAPGDPGAGTTPTLAALAYSLPPAGSAGQSSLYAIDTARDALVTSATGAATVRTIGALGLDATGPAAMDITAQGVAYAALRTPTSPSPQLYRIDLSTGRATPAVKGDATIASRLSSTARSDTPIIAMADLGPTSTDESKPIVVLAANMTPAASGLRRRGLPVTLSCSEACTASATLRVGRHRLSAVTGAVRATAGKVLLRIRMDAAARKLLRKDRTQGLGLTVTITDSAGNKVVARRRGATH
jgi:hypothetical protein